jgi:pimeloyl-ACP methyl ester carboxylesterase
MADISRRAFGGLVIGGSLGFAARAAAAPEAINEIGFVSIGGIEQWIAIQGRDRRNPLILFLHGGPGEAQSPFLDDFAPWLHDFTVVNWDQRGAGKTYARNGKSTPEVTMERLTTDAIEIAGHVLRKLGKRKLILMGQSFGTALGLLVARQAPELFYAYVGAAQFISTPRTTASWEEWARSQALASNDTEGLKALDAVAALPFTSAKRMRASRKHLFGPPDQPYIQRQAAFIGAADHPRPEAAAWTEGYQFESTQLAPQSMRFDAMVAAPDLPVPYILIEGREDHVTPIGPAKEYFDQLRSSGKAFVTIEGGHFACFTNPDGFLEALRQQVLPLTR